MQSSDAVNALISPWVARQLSSLAVISECLHQLHLSKPWSRKIEDDMEINDSTMRNTYKALFKDWIPVLGLMFEGKKGLSVCRPVGRKVQLPRAPATQQAKHRHSTQSRSKARCILERN